MKSRRALQIVVAVLSIALLACILFTATLVAIADYITVMPQPLVEFAHTFKAGMKAVSDQFYLYDVIVPIVAYSAPSLLLLVATILLLVKNKGKEAKNIVGCVFAFLGALVWALFTIVFAKQLFVETLQLAVYCASGGVLALFVLFACLSIFLRPKRTSITVFTEAAPIEDNAPETEEVSEEVEADVEQETLTEEVEESPEEEAEESVKETAQTPDEEAEEAAEEEEVTPETPATQYVPNLGVTIHDIVERTYGKEGDELSTDTLKKISKVRALYQAKAISEQEYIKLVRKYLGF